MEQKALEKAFTSAARTQGNESFLTQEGFIQVCREVLCIDLASLELARIYDNAVSHEGTWGLSFDIFVHTVQQRFFLSGVRRVLRLKHPKDVELPPHYDLNKETCWNHSASADEGFHGSFAAIRATRDHDYHGHYSRQRQLWQDSVLQTVVQRTPQQALPRIVFTCGAMGVGKGYALGWMSSEGIFPLENIVHIDPDHFKRVMPEWRAYIEHGKKLDNPDIPGNQCHRESCYLQELAFEESLRRSQNIWVDGSLRNAEWFVKVFDDIRERFPAYRIAIFEVTAPEHVIRKRVAERARLTGRSIPEKLLKDSIEAVERSVLTLMPRADFLASIDNTNEVPRLRYFATLDRSGDWLNLGRRFANTTPSPGQFPHGLAPLYVTRASGCDLLLNGPLLCVREGHTATQAGQLVVRGGVALPARVSSAIGVTLYGESRKVAKVPDEAVMVAWLSPPDTNSPLPTNLSTAQHNLVCHGGLVFYDLEEQVVGINALSLQSQGERPTMLRFGPPTEVSSEEAATIQECRWSPVTFQHLKEGGARRVAFLTPHEKVGKRRISSGSGLIFELESFGGEPPRFVFFQILRAPA